MTARETPWVNFQADAVTDSAGHFVIDHLPAAKGQVYLWAPSNKNAAWFTMTQGVHLQTTPGQTTHVRIGGMGQPVIGRLVMPAEFEGQMDWVALSPRITDVISPSQYPAQWPSMTNDEKNQWFLSEHRHYPMAITADGTFRVEDVLPGTYDVQIPLSETLSNGGSVLRQIFRREFTVPELPNGRSDEPLDLGDCELQPIQLPK